MNAFSRATVQLALNQRYIACAGLGAAATFLTILDILCSQIAKLTNCIVFTTRSIGRSGQFSKVSQGLRLCLSPYPSSTKELI